MIPRLNIFQQIAPDFWNYVKFLLEEVNPFVMISFALMAVGLLIPIIVKAFKKSDDDLDHDFEYREY